MMEKKLQRTSHSIEREGQKNMKQSHRKEAEVNRKKKEEEEEEEKQLKRKPFTLTLEKCLTSVKWLPLTEELGPC